MTLVKARLILSNLAREGSPLDAEEREALQTVLKMVQYEPTNDRETAYYELVKEA